jgi:hypothetical protein
MIPITKNTIEAVAALIYNYAYDQDPDCGWLADDGQSAPGHELQWLEWSAQLLRALKEQPSADDEQILATAKSRVDILKVGHSWDTIPADEDYLSMSEETNSVMNSVRHFLEHPFLYPEISFIENDPEYLAYLEKPIA